jgi:hypothetical protein
MSGGFEPIKDVLGCLERAQLHGQSGAIALSRMEPHLRVRFIKIQASIAGTKADLVWLLTQLGVDETEIILGPQEEI